MWMACDLIVYAKRRCLGIKPQHLIYVLDRRRRGSRRLPCGARGCRRRRFLRGSHAWAPSATTGSRCLLALLVHAHRRYRRRQRGRNSAIPAARTRSIRQSHRGAIPHIRRSRWPARPKSESPASRWCQTCAHAHPRPIVRPLAGFAQHFGGFDRCDRQALGRTVGRMHLGAGSNASQCALRTVAGTGAPHEKTLRSVGIWSPWSTQYWLRRSHTAGEANACVTFQSLAAASSFVGSADAGREKSMSGNTVVTPMAELNNPNSGKQAKSNPPGRMS